MMKKTLLALTLAAGLLAAASGSAVAAPDHFRGFLDGHPAIARELYRHPEYLHDHHWISVHPEFQQFLAVNPGIVALPVIEGPFPTWYPLATPYYPAGYVSYSNGSGFSIGVTLGGGYAPPPVYGPVYSAPVYSAPVIYPNYYYSNGGYRPYYNGQYGPPPVVTNRGGYYNNNRPPVVTQGHNWGNQGQGSMNPGQNWVRGNQGQSTANGRWQNGTQTRTQAANRDTRDDHNH